MGGERERTTSHYQISVSREYLLVVVAVRVVERFVREVDEDFLTTPEPPAAEAFIALLFV